MPNPDIENPDDFKMEEETNEKKEENLKEIADERKAKLFNIIFKKRNILVFLGLIFLIWLAWHIRTANLEQLKDITTNDYTLGPDLDPFLFLRYAKYIVENGKLMEHDDMRYVPLGWDTSRETRLLPYMIAYFHILLSKFKNISVEYSAAMFPVFMFLLTVIAFFLFVREVFKNKKSKDIIALVASGFLVVSPSLLARTVAGIPEKESASFLFIFLAFYFFLIAWKSEKIRTSVIFAALAGISTAITGLIWGGVRYVYLSFAIAVFVCFIFNKLNKKQILAYSIWILLSLILSSIFSQKLILARMIMSGSTTGPAFMVFFLMLIDFLIFNTKIKDLNIIKRLGGKIPEKVISIILFLIIGLIFAVLFFGFSFPKEFVNEIIFSLTKPYQDRLSFTVAENKQPYFNEWKNNFGPMFENIPLFFWLFFVGSILLFYDSIKNLEKKEKWLLTSFFAIFLLALIFSRHSPSSIMNGTGLISKFVYFSGFLLIVLGFCYVFYKNYKGNSLEILKRINSSYLLLIAFFVISVLGARSAIRLLMVLSIPASAIVGYLSVAAVEKARVNKNEILKIVLIGVAVIIISASIYSFYSNYQSILAQAKSMAPSYYTQQWQTAMKWVRENTKENSVFAHWWDYGYWIQTIGERATILDGGNGIDYWDHLLGRHVLTGQNEKEALEFLYAHNATHFLIDSTEIGKYGAYASIGSDENYDRNSQISTFIEDESQLRETKEDIVHLYRGSMYLEEEYAVETNDSKIILPSYQAGIAGVFLREGKNGELKQPQVIFVYQGKQYNLGLKCVYYKNKKYDFGTGYKGCLYIAPALVSENGRMFIKETGTSLFFTERAMRALWIKLYFFNEGENFKLVHSEDSFIVKDIKNQKPDIGDFVFFQGVQGPIKIWEVSYPANTKFKPEYLETSYPNESLRISTMNL